MVGLVDGDVQDLDPTDNSQHKIHVFYTYWAPLYVQRDENVVVINALEWNPPLATAARIVT